MAVCSGSIVHVASGLLKSSWNFESVGEYADDVGDTYGVS